MLRVTKLMLVVSCLVLTLDAIAADWPQFLGPNANSIAPGQGINKDWQQKAPSVLWQVGLSDKGYAGPSVAEGKVFIIDHAGGQDVVRALDLETGEEVWRFTYEDTKKHYYGFARATPVFSEGRLYTLSRLGLLHCLKADTGGMIWSRNIFADFDGKRPRWDYAMSPRVDGERLIVCPGGESTNVVALNKHTGETIWTGGNGDVPGYATPVIATILGQKQYVVFTGVSLIGVHAATGELLWRFPWKTVNDVNAATPVVQENLIFFSSHSQGCGLIEITSHGPAVRWTNKEIRALSSSPIYYNGLIFGTGETGHLVCLNPVDGSALWKHPGFERGGIVIVDGVIIAMDGKNGDVVIVNTSPDAYQELGRIKPLGGQSWTAPIIADGKLIIRNKSAIACLDIM